MSQTQTFKNHTRFFLPFHIGVNFALLVNLVWAVRQTVRLPSADHIVALVLAVGLILLAFCARYFALRAQDRVIRLEMRLRLAALLPADLKARIPELTLGPLIALRFAGDAELPALTRTVLERGLTSRAAIKALVTDWQADHLRV